MQSEKMLYEAKLRILDYLSKNKSEKRSYWWNLESLVIDEDKFKWEKFKSDPAYIPSYTINCRTNDKNGNEYNKEFVDYMMNMKITAENCTCQKKNEQQSN